MPMAAAAVGIISRPDCHAGKPKPELKAEWAVKKGNPPTPSRVMKPPITETRKVRTLKTAPRLQQRIRRLARMPPVGGQQVSASSKQRRLHRDVDVVLAENLPQPVHSPSRL